MQIFNKIALESLIILQRKSKFMIKDKACPEYADKIILQNHFYSSFKRKYLGAWCFVDYYIYSNILIIVPASLLRTYKMAFEK